jgi:hypothetical protein
MPQCCRGASNGLAGNLARAACRVQSNSLVNFQPFRDFHLPIS